MVPWVEGQDCIKKNSRFDLTVGYIPVKTELNPRYFKYTPGLRNTKNSKKNYGPSTPLALRPLQCLNRGGGVRWAHPASQAYSALTSHKNWGEEG